MRLSSNRNSPYYLLPHSRIAKVYLNGSEIKFATELDTEEGWVEVIKREENGNFVVDRAKGEIVTERLTGHVYIVLPGHD